MVPRQNQAEFEALAGARGERLGAEEPAGQMPQIGTMTPLEEPRGFLLVEMGPFQTFGVRPQPPALETRFRLRGSCFEALCAAEVPTLFGIMCSSICITVLSLAGEVGSVWRNLPFPARVSPPRGP